jgi:hypothetical protein
VPTPPPGCGRSGAAASGAADRASTGRRSMVSRTGPRLSSCGPVHRPPERYPHGEDG